MRGGGERVPPEARDRGTPGTRGEERLLGEALTAAPLPQRHSPGRTVRRKAWIPPQTAAHGLDDSPVALCAWLVEKRRSWSDCGGDVERRFTKDELLTAMTLYWVTESYGTSARFYYEAVHERWQPSHDRTPVIEAPTAIAVLPKEVVLMPHK